MFKRKKFQSWKSERGTERTSEVIARGCKIKITEIWDN
jgi:hypothetical protein